MDEKTYVQALESMFVVFMLHEFTEVISLKDKNRCAAFANKLDLISEENSKVPDLLQTVLTKYEV